MTDNNESEKSPVSSGIILFFGGIFKYLQISIVFIATSLWTLCFFWAPWVKKYSIIYCKYAAEDLKENWLGFIKTSGVLISALLICLIIYLPAISPVIAVFNMSDKADISTVDKVYEGKGISTIHAIMDPLKRIDDGVLMTNFFGVRFWADNKYHTQIGEFQMYRHILIVMRDRLGRNRSSSPANKYLVEAVNQLSVDSTAIYPVNFDFQLRKTIYSLKSYENNLIDDRKTKTKKPTAVFIVNSDNLAEAVKYMRIQLSSISDVNLPISFLNADDDYDITRGNLVATYNFLLNLGPDFKEKMIEKGAYEDAYLPLLRDLKSAIDNRPFFVSEFIFKDLSALRGKTSIIATKMLEFANKLSDG